jgi:hypothetical protein
MFEEEVHLFWHYSKFTWIFLPKREATMRKKTLTEFVLKALLLE